jgi:hypothetical protein
VKPSRPLATEYLFPINRARAQLRDRRVTSIRATNRAANTESAFGEIHSISNHAAHAVVPDPRDVRLIDAALIDQVLNKPADGIVRKRRYYCRVQAEASLQPSRNVVLAATFPNLKGSSGVNAPLARV